MKEIISIYYAFLDLLKLLHDLRMFIHINISNLRQLEFSKKKCFVTGQIFFDVLVQDMIRIKKILSPRGQIRGNEIFQLKIIVNL